MSGQSSDVQFVRCLKCLKVIKCSRYDTTELIQHVNQDHPEIMTQANEKIKNLYKLAADHGISQERLSEISKKTGMSEEKMADEAEKYMAKKQKSGISLPDLKISDQDAGESGGFRSSSTKPCDSRDLSRRQYYRSSIKRWTPTDGPLYCPNCGCCRPPMIKSRTELYKNTGCCAACLISCWPVCFLPCLISPENQEYLHCTNCKTFLGIYDRENNCIRPNREFVPSNVCNKDTASPKNCPCSSASRSPSNKKFE